MSGGKSGAMGMMDRCQMMGKMGTMMGVMGRNTITLPILQPGNEAMQLRMDGEILRAVGNIELKYASKIQPK